MAKKPTRLIIVLWAFLLFASIYTNSTNIYDGSILLKKYGVLITGPIFAFTVLCSRRQLVLKRGVLACLLLVACITLRIRHIDNHPFLTAYSLVLCSQVLAISELDCQEKRGLLWMIVIFACSLSILGILQRLGLARVQNSQFIVTGLFDNPAGFAACLCCGVGAFILIFSYDEKKATWHWLLLSILVVGILLSRSRSGILSTCLIALYFTKTKKTIKTVTGALVIIILVLLRIPSAIGRLLIWRVTVKAIIENDLFLGGGAYAMQSHYMLSQAAYLKGYETSLFIQVAGNVNHSFNELLEFILSYGLLGVGLIIIGLLVIWTKCDRKYFIAILPVFIFSLFSYPFHYPFVLLFLAFCIACSDRSDGVYIKPVGSKIMVFFLGIIFSLLIYIGWKDYLFERDWYLASLINNTNAISQYDKLSKRWNGNPYFLYNYALLLNREGAYKQAYEMMEACSQRINDYDVQLHLAEISINKRDTLGALKHYEIASSMIPNKLYPKNRMLHLYIEQGCNYEASEMAKRIVRTPVKIPSALFWQYRQEALDFLNKDSSGKD